MRHTPLPTRYGFLDHPCPLAFAHRGGALEREENTMAAFAHAVRLGYRYIETDVHSSRDGVPVVFHDDTLGRLTGAPGRMRDHPWRDLARLRTRGGEPLVRLEDALASFPDTRFNIDAKTDAAVAPIADAIRRCGALDRVCAGSFDVRRTHRLRALLGPSLCWSPSHGGVARLWLAARGVPMPPPDFPVVQIPPRFRGIPLATPRLVAAAHARGVQVHVWTVEDAPGMEHYLDIGVDGLMTDRPTLLRQVLRRRGQWPDDA